MQVHEEVSWLVRADEDSPWLSLWFVRRPLWAQTVRGFAERDAELFLMGVGSHEGLRLVAENVSALQRAGIYEAALLSALTRTSTNHSRMPLARIRILIAQADRDRLRAAGDPLPESDPVRLYRGVAGTPRQQRIRGLHWTMDVERAAWFARRFSQFNLLSDPAVYAVTVPASAILACTNNRHEAECLVLLPPRMRVERVAMDILPLDAKQERDR